MTNWDAIVIGAGLAGSSVAIQLAKLGKKVLLIEKEKASHHKVCGEFISLEAQHYLKLLGIDLLALGAKKITTVSFVDNNNSVQVPLPFEGLSLSRNVLDEALIKVAINLNVEVLRGVTVTNIKQNFELYNVFQSNGQIATAKSIFLASGKHDLRGFSRQQKAGNDFIGFKMYFKPNEKLLREFKEQVTLLFFDHGYAGLELVENNILNLSLVVNKSHYNDIGKDWESLTNYLSKCSAFFENYLTNSVPLWQKPLAIFSIPYGFIYDGKLGYPNLYHLGDQMAVISSFCGDGMSIALHSSFLAANHYLNGNAYSYHIEAYKAFKVPIYYAQIFATIVKNKFGRLLLFIVAKYFPYFIRLATVKTRVKF